MAKINIKWIELLPDIQSALKFFRSQGVTPTLRTVFYNLVGQDKLGNTKATYKGLSKFLVGARKKGLVSWYALADDERSVKGTFSDSIFSDSIVESNERKLDQQLENFNAKSILRESFDYILRRATVGKWANQDTICEIWSEKNAIAETVVQWTKDLDIQVRVNKGYSGWTFLHHNIMDLKQKLESHENLVIFYLGDLDPSGVDMDRFLKEAFAYFGLDVKFIRLGVTTAQIDQYHLPTKPSDPETIRKIENDPRTKNYAYKYFVEVDAMIAVVPTEFKRIIRSAIKSVWDADLYNAQREEAKEKNVEMREYLKKIKGKAIEILKDLNLEDFEEDTDDSEDDDVGEY